MTACMQCGEYFAEGRAKLGYRTCLPCGETQAVEQRKGRYPSAPINKSNYMLITKPEQLRQLNPKNPQP
jgi:predicted  nucleic acid-binding Zn-ribbon protein